MIFVTQSFSNINILITIWHNSSIFSLLIT